MLLNEPDVPLCLLVMIDASPCLPLLLSPDVFFNLNSLLLPICVLESHVDLALVFLLRYLKVFWVGGEQLSMVHVGIRGLRSLVGFLVVHDSRWLFWLELFLLIGVRIVLRSDCRKVVLVVAASWFSCFDSLFATQEFSSPSFITSTWPRRTKIFEFNIASSDAFILIRPVLMAVDNFGLWQQLLGVLNFVSFFRINFICIWYLIMNLQRLVDDDSCASQGSTVCTLGPYWIRKDNILNLNQIPALVFIDIFKSFLSIVLESLL